MLDMEKSMISPNRGFRNYDSVHDLERRFACEDQQMDLFDLTCGKGGEA